MEYLIYPALGIVAGLAAGLLGVGGGLIIVPVLIYTFAALGFSPAVLTHMAVGTSLATIIITSLGSVYQHHKKGAVLWSMLGWYATGLACGALAGAKLADLLNGRVLQMLFGAFAILIALQMAIGAAPKSHRNFPSAYRFSLGATSRCSRRWVLPQLGACPLPWPVHWVLSSPVGMSLCLT